MAKVPSFPFYAQDFDMDTNTWSNEEIGVYLRLLMSEWINGPLPNDTRKLSQIARISPKKFKNLFQICSKKFIRDGNGFLINKKMEKIREKVNKWVEQKKKAGMASAKKRWPEDNERYNIRSTDVVTNPVTKTCQSKSNIYIKKEKYKKERKKFYPDWLDVGLWFDFIKYRKTINAPLTEKAEKILITELEKLLKERQGTQKAIIEQTIVSGKWTGLFPVKIRDTPNAVAPYKPPKMPTEDERVSQEEIRKTIQSLKKGRYSHDSDKKNKI